jgi:hypothetical protein
MHKTTGREASDVASYCCDDKGGFTIFIGFQNESGNAVRYQPVPRGRIHLPPAALKAYREADEAWARAMQRGVAGEDDSQGFALSIDPEAKAKQLALHAYAVRRGSMIQRVLREAADAEQRQIAAQMLGYSARSPVQIRALSRAARDPDAGVRNDALRALGVIAEASPAAARMIAPEEFVSLLGSGVWTDRNKAGALFAALSARRDPRLLEFLHARALGSILEMARWQSRGHAYFALLILGRITNLPEMEIHRMIGSGETEAIIQAASTPRKPSI